MVASKAGWGAVRNGGDGERERWDSGGDHMRCGVSAVEGTHPCEGSLGNREKLYVTEFV